MTDDVAHCDSARQPDCRNMMGDRTIAICDNDDMGEPTKHFFREWREYSKLTQDQASEASGIARNYLSELERNKRRHNADILDSLAKAYSCEPWELLGRNPLEDEPEPIVRIWSRINDKAKQAQALQILETFTDKKKA
jgi:transcriptional regulator with XRE-family HTH domain